MPLHTALSQMATTLSYMDSWLDDAVAYATEREFDPEVLLGMRLHPDMRPLMFQLQSAADALKLAYARLGDKKPPVHEDNETTLAQIRARLASVSEFLATFEAKDFEGAESRILKLGFLPEGKVIRGERYFFEMAQPNFFFHATTAYAILRHAGVKLGKRRFIQTLTLEDG